jgi:hypothetical protein
MPRIRVIALALVVCALLALLTLTARRHYKKRSLESLHEWTAMSGAQLPHALVEGIERGDRLHLAHDEQHMRVEHEHEHEHERARKKESEIASGARRKEGEYRYGQRQRPVPGVGFPHPMSPTSLTDARELAKQSNCNEFFGAFECVRKVDCSPVQLKYKKMMLWRITRTVDADRLLRLDNAIESERGDGRGRDAFDSFAAEIDPLSDRDLAAVGGGQESDLDALIASRRQQRDRDEKAHVVVVRDKAAALKVLRQGAKKEVAQVSVLARVQAWSLSSKQEWEDHHGRAMRTAALAYLWSTMGERRVVGSGGFEFECVAPLFVEAHGVALCGAAPPSWGVPEAVRDAAAYASVDDTQLYMYLATRHVGTELFAWTDRQFRAGPYSRARQKTVASLLVQLLCAMQTAANVGVLVGVNPAYAQLAVEPPPHYDGGRAEFWHFKLGASEFWLDARWTDGMQLRLLDASSSWATLDYLPPTERQLWLRFAPTEWAHGAFWIVEQLREQLDSLYAIDRFEKRRLLRRLETLHATLQLPNAARTGTFLRLLVEHPLFAAARQRPSDEQLSNAKVRHYGYSNIDMVWNLLGQRWSL